MKQDTIGRRDRYTRIPLGTNHYITPKDIQWLAFLHRHGGRLPTSYLHNFTSKDTTPQNTIRRLNILFNELKLLKREWQQKDTADPRNNELIHTLDTLGIEVLKEEGLYNENVPSPAGAFKHQVFQGCVSASLELNTVGTDLTFTPQHELGPTAIPVGDDTVYPDYVCKLTKGNKSTLLFVEVDRGTEATYSTNYNRKSWSRSVKQYRKLIQSGLYKKHFNHNGGALLLIVTVTSAKEAGILEVINREFPKGCKYMLVTHIPEFGREFKPPKELHLLDRNWLRAGEGTYRFKE